MALPWAGGSDDALSAGVLSWHLGRFGWTSLLAAMLFSGTVSAQSADASPQSEGSTPQAMTEVTITGSRIRLAPGLETPTPVTVLTNDELHKLAPGNLANALDDIPAFFNNVNASQDFGSNVPAAQGTNVNLRGLGPNRTLTLLSGRRVVPGSKIGTVNIANFPAAAIERVDVVTGGASAVYGTDAVAGVANFILNTDFTGFRGNAQGGISSRGDAGNGQLALTFGTPIGQRMHLILSGEVYGEEGIQGSEDRSWYRHWGTMPNPEFLATGKGPKRIRAPELVSTEITCGGLILQPGSKLDHLEFNPDGSVSPFRFSSLSAGNAQSLAFSGGSGCNPPNPSSAGPSFTNDLNTRNFFGYLDYDATDNLNLYAQVIHGHGLVSTTGGGGTLRSPWQITIFRDNAFLPQEVAQMMDEEGLTSFHMQRDIREFLTHHRLDIINTTLSLTAGFNLDINTDNFFDDWRVEGYYQWGRNKQENAFFGFVRAQTINASIDAVRDPATGRIVCHAALVNPDWADCVPINIFGSGNASADAIRYVTTPEDGGINHFFYVHEEVAELSANGKLFNGWAGPISGALGATYRKESIESFETGLSVLYDTPTNDVPGIRGVPGGYAGDPDVQLFGSFADVDGAFNVKEVFAESLIPLVSDVPLIRQLSLAPAIRWANYSGSGDILAYKIGLDWEVNEQLRFRATHSRDVRAATLAERFDRQRANGRVQDDPVTGRTYDFSQTTGGNPNVSPEKADTITFGVVYQPAWFSGFSATVDWYDIDISDAIGRLSTQDIIDRCFQGAQSLCDLITRDPLTLAVTNVDNLYININEEKASGIDLELHYNKSLDGTFLDLFKEKSENLSVRFLGTWLHERSTLIPGAPKLDVVGQIPAGGDIRESAYPEFVWSATLTYNVGPFSAYVQQRYLDGGVVDVNDVEGVDIDDNSVDPVWYTDLRLSYQLGSWEIFGQAINLFDQHPPLAPDGFEQTNTGFYDIKGQRFIVGARFQF